MQSTSQRPSKIFKLVLGFTAAMTTAMGAGFLPSLSPVQAVEFDQQDVDQTRFVVVAAPRSGGTAHNLLILEQITNVRECWSESGSAPIVVDPLLLTFDFTGICGRSLDSNGYSIRLNGEDAAFEYSPRIVRRNGELILVGTPGNRREPELEIGRAGGETNEFAKIQLNPGWRLTRRTLEGRTVGHLYLTYEGDLAATFSPEDGAPRPPRPPEIALPFPDIRGDIYAQEIALAVELGFVAGYAEDNTFRPQQPVTREQLVSMVLDGLRKLESSNPNAPAISIPQAVSTAPYRDVPADRWSAAKIQVARDLNIVSGYQDGTFRPAQNVTRAEMMAILRRAAEYGQNMRNAGTELRSTVAAKSFSDIGGHWAESLITQMSSYCGVASPVNERGTAFAPNTEALRNYATAATLRMLSCARGQVQFPEADEAGANTPLDAPMPTVPGQPQAPGVTAPSVPQVPVPGQNQAPSTLPQVQPQAPTLPAPQP